MNMLAERLQEILEKKNWTRVKFAKVVGITPQSAYDYCNGRREPSLDMLVQICDALGESSDYMLGRTDQ